MSEKIKRIEKWIKENYNGDLHHGWPHLDRVRKYALRIGEKEGGDVELLEIASLFHDISKITYGGTVENHAEKSGIIAKEYLESIGMKKGAEEVYDIIRTHSRREKPDPKTLNQKILYDADGLELIGTVGLMRIGLHAAYCHETWKTMIDKMKERLDMSESFYTKTAKKMARKRLKLIKEFSEELEKEIGDGS